MPPFAIRYSLFVILALLLSACRHARSPSGPAIIKTGIKPPSITIDAATGWAAAPVARGTPLFTDDYYSVQFFPSAMQGAILIQRPESIAAAGGYLDGKITVPEPATLYLALMYQNNDTRLIPDADLNALAKEGWTKTPGIFSTSSPEGQTWYWTVYAHSIPAGPVTLTAKALEKPAGIFIIGKQH
jgi:hypothetical protein